MLACELRVRSRVQRQRSAPRRHDDEAERRPGFAVRALLACVLGVFLLSGKELLAQDESGGSAAPSSVAERSLQLVYQPAAADFHVTGEQLQQALARTCEARDQQALEAVWTAYAEAVKAFAHLELYRVGPLLQENRQNRLFYWPDKRRVGERQMRALLADPQAAELNPETVAGKSVALQGFPALERLLYGNQPEQHLATRDTSPHCRIALAIAGNVAHMATQIHTGWQRESAQVQSFLQPKPGDDYFRSENEVLRSIVTQILVGMDVILDRKIALLIGDEARLRSAPLWRSGQTLRMLDGNLESLRALVLDSGLASETSLENELFFEFRTIDSLMQRLLALPELSIDNQQLTEEAESLLRTLQAVAGGIRYTLNDRFVAELGISAGFNSEDGD